MTLSGPEGLQATAVPLDNPIKIENQHFERAICIDTLGFAATTLFDIGGNNTDFCVFPELKSLAFGVPGLNDAGILVRFRILLVYPYSLAGQVRIQAERSRRRASVEEPRYHRTEGQWFLEQVTKESTLGSEMMQAQLRTLGAIHELKSELGGSHSLMQRPNGIEVRFSTIHPLVCGLRVNDEFFYDVYSLGKEHRAASRCSTNSPVISLSHDERAAYSSFCDHFRYLWEYDATLDYADAVIEGDELAFRPQDRVDFQAKARRTIKAATNKEPDDAVLHNYAAQAAPILRRNCTSLRPELGSEVAFIACSWAGEDATTARPSSDAKQVQQCLINDFGERSVPTIGVFLLVAQAGEGLAGRLYDALDQSSIGIVVLSPEIPISSGSEDSFICTPNVYHELGFLMSHVSRKRTFLFVEKKVQKPSNVDDLVHITYEDGKIALKYPKLLRGFFEAGIAPAKTVKNLAQQFLNGRLTSDLTQGRISQNEFNAARNTVFDEIMSIT